ncbi:hypothetical protein TTHERM_00716150 (macronuclear) [Tetrahymena thermophila SB210]|uniref:Kinase domain protein n=1 Tax=Tetrahymena thermophila (strain SB210) TaxID=312017 RepID=I7MFU5_TETTS|nr:hypothetical protein TTHERM_00716150 [Tetrahymena thermophila SB210]EAR84309.2 hypothetical protein TTHERM_00716150 [Tetrahymena thermophila SB210]|eukprot:XP_001031972.2 hypothetical protein TTHERM_00716150 [Tetrahymena thermophila SB210]
MDLKAIEIYNHLTYWCQISKEYVKNFITNLQASHPEIQQLEYLENSDFSLTLKGFDSQNSQNLAIKLYLLDQTNSKFSNDFEKAEIQNEEQTKELLHQIDFDQACIRIYNFYDYTYSEKLIGTNELLRLSEQELKYVRNLQLVLCYNDNLQFAEINQKLKQISRIQNLKLIIFDKIGYEFEEIAKIICNFKNIVALSVKCSERQDTGQAYNNLSQIKSLKRLSISDLGNDEQLQGILSLVQNQQNLKQVKLSFQKKLNNQLIIKLAQIFMSLKDIESIDLILEKTELQYSTYENIMECLSKCSKLKCLNLNFYENNFKINNTENKQKGKSELDFLSFQELCFSLGFNKISQQGFKDLEFYISSCLNLKNLTLNLQRIVNDAQGGILLAQTIADSIQNCQKIENLSLNLLNNKLSSKGLVQLSKGLQNLSSLSSLILILANNDLNDNQNIESFGVCISKLSKLNKLMIDFNGNILTSIGANYLSNGLSNCKQIKELMLKFDQSNLSPQGAKSLGNCIAQLPNLAILFLNVRKNEIRDEGLIYISEGIQHCSFLKSLNLHLVYHHDFKKNAVKVKKLTHLIIGNVTY